MKKQRLLKLADELEADARRKKRCIEFNMMTWGAITNAKSPISCGTRACAMGFAAISGAFKHQGLSWNIEQGWFQYKPLDPNEWGKPDGYAIAKHLFEIDELSALFLFSSNSYSLDESKGKDAERGVAQRIRTFVANGGRLTDEQRLAVRSGTALPNRVEAY